MQVTASAQCSRRDELMDETQQTLMKLAELARHQAEALRTGSDNLVMALDKEIETTLGDKERTLGALREHRKEHLC
jgi:hypothetical protein